MIDSIWKKKRRARLRQSLRVFRKRRAAGTLGKIDDLCAELARTPVVAEQTSFSNFFFGAATSDARPAIQQYAFLRQVLYKLPPALLGMTGRLAYPLPRVWQDVIIRSGIEVNRTLSSLLWVAWLIVYWGHGTVQIVRLLATTATSTFSGEYRRAEDFSHFEYISQSQTIRPAPDGRSYDVMSWYSQWSGRAPTVTKFTYRGDPLGMRMPFLPAIASTAWLAFAAWSAVAVAASFVCIFAGRWWLPLLLGEAALARLARSVPQRSLAKDYLLNNSGWLYRPLWTYEVEQRGSRVLFYHYSTNSAAFKRPAGYPPNYTWRLSNWPHHLVWDQGQADFVQRETGSADVDIVGPIWFASSPDEMPHLPPATIAVFDVQPFRPSKAPAIAAIEFNYYEVETCNAFVGGVSRVCAEYGYQMAWKRKRSIGKMAHPKYREFARHLDHQPHVQIVSSEHSAIRVIEQSCAVISLPFTSTALLAAQLGKPSCYYDPTGQIHKDDRAAHDIPIVTGYDELTAWIRSLPGSASAPQSHASIS